MGFVVDELFAFVTEGDTGDEGIIAVEIKGGLLSLVAADLTRVQEMIPFAEAIREQTGHEYKLKHFTLLGDVSDEYLEQFSEAPGTAVDDQGEEGDGESAPDRRRGGNGGTPPDS